MTDPSRRDNREALRPAAEDAERRLGYEEALEQQRYRAIKELRELQWACLGGAALGPVTIAG